MTQQRRNHPHSFRCRPGIDTPDRWQRRHRDEEQWRTLTVIREDDGKLTWGWR